MHDLTSVHNIAWQACNMFHCNCESCYPGCANCIAAEEATKGFGGALAPAVNMTLNATATAPCAAFEAFSALTVPQLMDDLSAAFCASSGSSVGFKFLGYVLNLVDANKDGVITCSEYNADQVSNYDALKKKPDCPLQAGIKLKNAHSKA